MLVAFSWVPKGAMKPTSILSTDTISQARAKLQHQNPEYVEESKQANRRGQKELKKQRSPRAADRGSRRHGKQQCSGLDSGNEEDDDDSDEGDNTVVNEMLRDIAGGGTDAILEDIASEDEDEIEDTRFKDTDLVFTVGCADTENPRVELYTYDEPEDNIFLHHDMEIAALPLCSSWLTDGSMSMLAVGTMLPFIEVWALDVMDSVEPAIFLGGCKEVAKNYNSKNIRKHLKEESHTEAVLDVKWNTIAQNILSSGSADHTIKLWDLNTATCLGTYAENEKVQSLDWHPTEANQMLSGGFDSSMVLRDCRYPQQPALRFTLPSVVEHVEFFPHGGEAPEAGIVMASTSKGEWAAFDTRNATQPLWHLKPHKGEVVFACSRHVRGLCATGGKDGKISLWDCRQIGLEPTLCVSRNYRTGDIFSIAFHPNSPHILGACGAAGEPLVYTMTDDIYPVFKSS
ncbi:unnamed protein product [Phytomonas sp. EM1]|nr:unnamed protein product [Phytomonas sp. EM1]|eukprot:CCW62580.1 unnamed protein product [Phytomonas sp. isolate EM1]